MAGRCYLKPNRLAIGAAHTCANTSAGIYCWGRNTLGQLGRGTTSMFSTTPAIVMGTAALPNATTSARADHTCYTSISRQGFCWGNNSHGQLGDMTSMNRSAAVMFSGSAFATAAGVGANHSCLIEATSVACVGANDQGQLGQGITSAGSLMPVTVRGGGAAPFQLGAGDDFTCVSSSAGEAVQCWGANDRGQLGDGTTNRAAMPVAVTAVNLPLVAAGARHACAANPVGGAIVCWGDNSDGQLGDGTLTMRTTAVAPVFSSIVLAKKIAAGGAHTCMIDANDALWCWGRNAEGQLGIGTISANERVPQRVPIGPTDEVQCGPRHTCARTLGSDVWCWGDNSEGQLGDGTTTPSSLPVSALPFP